MSNFEDSKIYEELDAIDAAVFTGDPSEVREALVYYMERWTRGLGLEDDCILEEDQQVMLRSEVQKTKLMLVHYHFPNYFSSHFSHKVRNDMKEFLDNRVHRLKASMKRPEYMVICSFTDKETSVQLFDIENISNKVDVEKLSEETLLALVESLINIQSTDERKLAMAAKFGYKPPEEEGA